jgi:hypothetical protein
MNHLAIPHWIFAVACAAPVLLRLRHFSRKNRRLRGGLCLGCGYDLRATVERCPECGRPIVSPQSKGAAAMARVAIVLAMLSAPARAGAETAPATTQSSIAVILITNPDSELISRTVPELSLENATLGQALDAIRAAMHVNIVVRPPLDQLKEGNITLHVRDATLGRTIQVVLDLVEPGILHFCLRDGVIIVSRSEFDNDETFVRVYDVRDLIAEESARRRAQDNPIPTTEPSETEEDQLARLIKAAVEPNEWQDAGGRYGKIESFAGRLVVTQSEEGHGRSANSCANSVPAARRQSRAAVDALTSPAIACPVLLSVIDEAFRQKIDAVHRGLHRRPSRGVPVPAARASWPAFRATFGTRSSD